MTQEEKGKRLRTAALALVGGLALAGCGGRKQPTPGATASAAISAAASAAPVASQRCAAQGPRRLERASFPAASSSIALVKAAGRRLALVADFDEKALHVVDTASLRQVGVTPLPGRPGHVLLLASGLVAVTLRDTGRVILLEPADDALARPLEERCSAEVTAEPWALAEQGERLLVASGFGAALTVLHEENLAVERRVPLPREPRSLLIVDGAAAFVSHAVGGLVSVVDLKDPAKDPESIRLHAGKRTLDPSDGTALHPRESSQGHAIALIEGKRADGQQGTLRILVPNLSVDPGAPNSPPSPGYGGGALMGRPEVPIVSVVDPGTRRSITNEAMRAFAGSSPVDGLLPRGAVADGRSLFVAYLDSDAIVELDPWLVDPAISERRRFAVPAGPSAVALADDGAQIFAYSEFDRALSRIERESGAVASAALWRRAGEARDARIERGRRMFHTSRDARLGLGRPCAGCHPDGRDDGLLWTSPAGRRQTPILAGRLEGTAPYGWFGESPTVKEHLRKTFARLGGTGLDDARSEEDFEALLAYVAVMPAPPRAAPADAALVARGQAVFGASCEGCHKSGGSNGLGYDVGTGNPRERPPITGAECVKCHKSPAEEAPKKDRAVIFDTPTLRAVRGSAPYFHDGRYATLDEMLSARDSRMIPSPLSDGDRAALVAYLETL